jgi:endoglucanase
VRRLAGRLTTAGLAFVAVLVATYSTQGHSGNVVAASVAPASAIGHSQTYRVVGNHIVNSNGQWVIVHGVNRSSLENSCTGATVTGQETGIPSHDFAVMQKSWRATVVRLPLDQNFWLSDCHHYRAIVRRAVREIEADHMIAILDLHWWTDQVSPTYATAAQAMCMPDQSSVIFWTQVADAYKDDPDVWFELYNEPNPPGATTAAQWHAWLDGGSVDCANHYTGLPMGDFTAVGMQQLASAIRTTGATNIVLADGISKASTLDGVPLLSGANIAYAIHPYLNPMTTPGPGWNYKYWEAEFGNLARHVPVIATEFGDFECGNTSYAYGYERAVLSYFRTHRISYLAWDWFAKYDCSVPELIDNAAGHCRSRMGCMIQQDMKSYAAVTSGGASSNGQRSRSSE